MDFLTDIVYKSHFLTICKKMDNKMEVIDVVGKFLKMMAPFSNNLLILQGSENIFRNYIFIYRVYNISCIMYMLYGSLCM